MLGKFAKFEHFTQRIRISRCRRKFEEWFNLSQLRFFRMVQFELLIQTAHDLLKYEMH